MSFLARVQSSVSLNIRRNIGFTAILAQKGQASDPIQNLFVQSLREYDQKSKSAGGKLVDTNPETEKELQTELNRIAKIFGGDGKEDMTKFPSFKFPEPKLDPINAGESK